MAKYCQKCNHSNRDSANYCERCNTKLSRTPGNGGNSGRVKCRFCDGTGKERVFGFIEVCHICGGSGTLRR